MATVNIVKCIREKGIRYQVYYKDPYSGRKKYYKTFTKQREAQQASNDLRALLDTGKLPNQKLRIRMMTFSEVADELVTDWNLKRQTGELRPKVVDDYVYTLNVVKKDFGHMLLGEISEDQIKSYRAKVAYELSNVSSNKRLAVIKKVCAMGVALNAVFDNPAKGIKILSEKDHERNRYLLPNEIFTLVEGSKSTKAKHYLPVLIYLGCEHGASKQEALSLKWSDINFDFENSGMIRFYRTKTGHERTEYLMPHTKIALLHWKKHQELMRKRRGVDGGDSDLVFSHFDGSPIKCFNRAWWAALEVAGIKDFHFHDLRHCFCSNLLLSGGSLKDAKEMIGHKDISMTDRYSHLTLEHKRLKQQQLSEYYGTQITSASE
jgi:integrase